MKFRKMTLTFSSSCEINCDVASRRWNLISFSDLLDKTQQKTKSQDTCNN